MSFFRLSGCAATILALCVALPATTQSQSFSAQESDPNVMGWMQGFPPPEDKIITQPDSIYFSFPRLRWSVCHLREFLPTEEISRGLGAPNPLNYVSSQDFDLAQVEIDALTFTPMNSDAVKSEMCWIICLDAAPPRWVSRGRFVPRILRSVRL